MYVALKSLLTFFELSKIGNNLLPDWPCVVKPLVDRFFESVESLFKNIEPLLDAIDSLLKLVNTSFEAQDGCKD